MCQVPQLVLPTFLFIVVLVLPELTLCPVCVLSVYCLYIVALGTERQTCTPVGRGSSAPLVVRTLLVPGSCSQGWLAANPRVSGVPARVGVLRSPATSPPITQTLPR